MSGITKFQILTVLLGATVITTTILQYNNPTYNQNLTNFFDQLAASLGFFFAGYVYLTSIAAAGGGFPEGEKNLYRWFAFLLIFLAWLLTFITGLSTAWQRVKDNVADPIAQASLFALPILLLGFFSVPGSDAGIRYGLLEGGAAGVAK